MATEWTAPQRPAEYAEQALIEAILDGTYPPGATLPGERDLAARLGVTRPTLREALQRLARDGWLTIQQGKPTAVRDLWREGGLNILGVLLNTHHTLPFDLVARLMDVRLVLSPAYARAAAAAPAADRATLLAHLAGHTTLPETPAAYVAYDWGVHHELTVASGNPIYTLILNGFKDFFTAAAQQYFALPEARAASQRFYAQLLAALQQGDAAAAEQITHAAMLECAALWPDNHENHR